MLNNLYQVLSIESKISLLRTSVDPEGGGGGGGGQGVRTHPGKSQVIWFL